MTKAKRKVVKKETTVDYRHNNFYSAMGRVPVTLWLDPAVVDGMTDIAKDEDRSMCWVGEEALSDYFGVKVLLRTLKGKPKPAMKMRHNMKLVVSKRRA